jgi:ribosomal protein S18 acetylase RimI-like enzyme
VDNIEYRQSCEGITAQALQDLFRAADLGGRVGDKILRAFKNSGIACFALTDDRLIGACRAMTDSEYHAFVYDVAVHPDYQGRGVGKLLTTRLLSRLSVWRVMLVADEEVQGFYRQFGFAQHNDVMARIDPQRLSDRTE